MPPPSRTTPDTVAAELAVRGSRAQGTSRKPRPSSIMAKRPDASARRWRAMPETFSPAAAFAMRQALSRPRSSRQRSPVRACAACQADRARTRVRSPKRRREPLIGRDGRCARPSQRRTSRAEPAIRDASAPRSISRWSSQVAPGALTWAREVEVRPRGEDQRRLLLAGPAERRAARRCRPAPGYAPAPRCRGSRT